MSSPLVAGEQWWKVSVAHVEHLAIAIAFDVSVLPALQTDNAQTLNPAAENILLSHCNKGLAKMDMHLHVSTVQAIFEHSRHATQHIQTLRSESEELLRGPSRAIDGRRASSTRSSARLPRMTTTWSTDRRSRTRRGARPRRRASIPRPIAVWSGATMPGSRRTR